MTGADVSLPRVCVGGVGGVTAVLMQPCCLAAWQGLLQQGSRQLLAHAGSSVAEKSPGLVSVSRVNDAVSD
jgi:hypothetical protein